MEQVMTRSSDMESLLAYEIEELAQKDRKAKQDPDPLRPDLDLSVGMWITYLTFPQRAMLAAKPVKPFTMAWHYSGREYRAVFIDNCSSSKAGTWSLLMGSKAGYFFTFSYSTNSADLWRKILRMMARGSLWTQ